MKILVVCQYYYPEQFRINDICETLVSEGHDVTVLTGLPNYPKGNIYPGYRWFRKRKEIISGVNVIRVSLIGRGKNFLRLVLNYTSFVINSFFKILLLPKDFDVVYVYQLSPVTMAIPALLYKKLTGKKVLLYCLDIWPESIAAAKINRTSLIYRWLLGISRRIYKGVDWISVTSQSFIDYLGKVIKLKGDNVDYLPQYAEELYEYKNNEGNPATSSIGIDLLFAGNIGEMQSVETIILAANELKEEENLRWHIVGDGSSRKKCVELVNLLGISDKVVFYGYRPVTEMPDFFRKATCLLVTLKDNEYISYTLPGKIQSYMAAGKPIIGAINGEAKRVIEESACGLCCEAEDYKGLAEKVKVFISDKEKIVEFSRNARNFYENSFIKAKFMKCLSSKLNEMVKE